MLAMLGAMPPGPLAKLPHDQALEGMELIRDDTLVVVRLGLAALSLVVPARVRDKGLKLLRFSLRFVTCQKPFGPPSGPACVE